MNFNGEMWSSLEGGKGRTEIKIVFMYEVLKQKTPRSLCYV